MQAKPQNHSKSKAPIRRAHGARPNSRRGDDANRALHRFLGGFRWEGVELEPYKTSTQRGGEFAGASRQVLVGAHGEQVKFHVRYFELEPGGFTSFERHGHSHVVICVRGSGKVRIGNTQYRVGRLDTIYIGPAQPHQLAAQERGTFGFFCIVDAKRDKPRPVTV
jgi:quercetin dioxygenase-like cupin family protein